MTDDQLKLERDNAELRRENAALRLAILNQAGDNLCWVQADTKIPPKAEFLESCSRFHAQVSGEVGELTGCKTIAQLEAEIERLKVKLEVCEELGGFIAKSGPLPTH